MGRNSVSALKAGPKLIRNLGGVIYRFHISSSILVSEKNENWYKIVNVIISENVRKQFPSPLNFLLSCFFRTWEISHLENFKNWNEKEKLRIKFKLETLLLKMISNRPNSKVKEWGRGEHIFLLYLRLVLFIFLPRLICGVI